MSEKNTVALNERDSSSLLSSCGVRMVASVLLDKPDRRNPEHNLTVDYHCFKIPDEFVVGYGLDFAEKYRNLPDIGVLDSRVYGAAHE